ncbi:serine hydrolase [uncultured Kordia sp.]|uniref:serine hydrolase domain-containing protein n=1 Tax=uncultured Kordia sp. TaxID=507699 RepID=UPI002620A0FC|nr:serine hydrolase [uncultured Kordia sp.]
MKKVVLAVCVFMFYTYCKGQNSTPNEVKKKIETYLNTLGEKGFSGSVLVAYKGKKLVSDGYGLADREKNVKNTKQTVFDIGSITKQFTAAGILKLEMQGELAVDDKISKYFKNVPKDKQAITIHHLLTHSAGLPPAIGDDYEHITKADFLHKTFKEKLAFNVGSAYEYSNVGYTLLAMIIEKVSGETYENYLYKNLWKPAKMDQTGYERPNYNPKEIAVGYRTTKTFGKPNEKWDANGPSWHLKGNGGILSTVEDMYKWHKALVGTKILSTNAKQKYYTKYIEEGEDAGSYYGYGWAIFPTPRNTELIAHNGGNGVFFADFWRYLTEDIVIFSANNAISADYERINMEIAGIILRKDYEPNTDLGETREGDFDKVELEQLAMTFLSTIQKKDKVAWKEFIETQTMDHFAKMISMEKHLEMFAKIHEKVKNKKLTEVRLEGDELILILTDKELILNLEVQNEVLKVAGIFIE